MPKGSVRVSVKVRDLKEVKDAIRAAYEKGYQEGKRVGMRNAAVMIEANMADPNEVPEDHPVFD